VPNSPLPTPPQQNLNKHRHSSGSLLFAENMVGEQDHITTQTVTVLAKEDGNPTKILS